MGGACNTQRRFYKCAKILFEEPERKRPLWRHGHKWKSIIKMELGCDDVDWL
jgi:hypothetical protein